jgi:nucleoside-diphosphate-sugar epimerase
MKLVTGGAGYLGGQLARELLERGHEVRVFDVAHSPSVPEQAEFLQGDMRRYKDVSKALEDVDAVFHLAFVQSLSKRPLREKYEVNIAGTRNFLRAAAEEEVESFVFASTIEIYGAKPPFPCEEDAPTDNPIGWYGRHKLECERLAAGFAEKGLNAVSLRMPAVCGPGSYNHGPMLDMMDRIMANQPIAAVGDGSIPANMTHYKDAVDALILAAQTPGAAGEAFNIASDGPAAQIDILNAMKDAVGSRSPVIFVPASLAAALLGALVFFGALDIPDHQIGHGLHPSNYSIGKAKNILGYNPQFTTLDSAREQILGYRENREYVRQRNKNY